MYPFKHLVSPGNFAIPYLYSTAVEWIGGSREGIGGGSPAELVHVDAAVVVHLHIVQHVLRLLTGHLLPETREVRQQLRLPDVPAGQRGRVA